jgi:DNA-binding response OmpR family regulator
MFIGCFQPIQEEYGKSCGADAYVTKPWNPKEVMELTRTLLSRRPPTA